MAFLPTPPPPSVPLQAQFSKAITKMQEIIGQVNEDVRRQEEQARAANVLLSEVGGEAAALLTAARTLAMECELDLKVSSGGGFGDPTWHVRGSYKWCASRPATHTPRLG